MYHPTFLIVFINICIIAMIGVVGLATGNPLVIFGLYLLPQVPVFSVDTTALPNDDLEEDESQPMGFTADLKSHKK